MNEKTICALATAAGSAGIAVIRISGPQAKEILNKIVKKSTTQWEPRHMYLGTLTDGEKEYDTVLGVYFPAPHSYTGEDLAEIHCHGGNVGVSIALECAKNAGACPAQPGEFTKRAFLNGKIDLSQAEAVMDYIGAMSKTGASVASRQMAGNLERAVLAMQDRLTDLIAQMEAGIEYPEEDLEEDLAGQALPQLASLIQDLKAYLDTFDQGKFAREGIRIAIVGKPNVGKSSLLNAIFGEERAIVTHIPGTTRDVIQEYYLLNGIPCLFMDTAGIHETQDVVEEIGVRRSREAIAQSDLVLFLADASADLSEEDREILSMVRGKKDVVCVLNKQDLSIKTEAKDLKNLCGDVPCVLISAKERLGLDELLAEIQKKAAVNDTLLEGVVISNERHKFAMEEALRALIDARSQLEIGLDLDCAAIDLNAAWSALGKITGRTVSEEIIDRIFSRFCLGK